MNTAPGRLKWCMRHAYLIAVLLVICCMNIDCVFDTNDVHVCFNSATLSRNLDWWSVYTVAVWLCDQAWCLRTCSHQEPCEREREVIAITLYALLFYNVCIGLGTRPVWFPDIMIQGQLYQVENEWASWGRTESRIPGPDWDRYFQLNFIPRPVLSTNVRLQQHFRLCQLWYWSCTELRYHHL